MTVPECDSYYSISPMRVRYYRRWAARPATSQISFCCAGRAGFTLIEMVVVVAIVAVLASAALPFVQFGENRLKERELRHSLREIRTAIDSYRKAVEEGRIPRAVNSSGYPPSLEVLADGVTDAKMADGRKIFFLRRIPHDPFAVSEIPERGAWGLRSYASPPGEPTPGADVFDVYSLSQGTGSNGIPYRQW